MDIGHKEIYDWHVNGNGWKDVGYHFIIRRDGAIEKGRSATVWGAHAKGYNDRLGVCMVGGKAHADQHANNFTPDQWETLKSLVLEKKSMYGFGEKDIIGHNQISSKSCPSFDVKKWKKENLK